MHKNTQSQKFWFSMFLRLGLWNVGLGLIRLRSLRWAPGYGTRIRSGKSQRVCVGALALVEERLQCADPGAQQEHIMDADRDRGRAACKRRGAARALWGSHLCRRLSDPRDCVGRVSDADHWASGATILTEELGGATSKPPPCHPNCVQTALTHMVAGPDAPTG